MDGQYIRKRARDDGNMDSNGLSASWADAWLGCELNENAKGHSRLTIRVRRASVSVLARKFPEFDQAQVISGGDCSNTSSVFIGAGHWSRAKHGALRAGSARGSSCDRVALVARPRIDAGGWGARSPGGYGLAGLASVADVVGFVLAGGCGGLPW